LEPVQNPSSSNPAIVYNPNYENVPYIEITISKTTDNSIPAKVQIGIFGCAEPGSIITKPQLQVTTTSSSKGVSSSIHPYLTTITPPSNVSQTSSNPTTSHKIITKRCEEMQAVDEATTKNIIVTPRDIPQEEKTEFQPTSKRGVSFPETDRNPVITIYFGKPAEVQSVTIPRDKTNGANVQQFEVTFYSPDANKINDKPIKSTSSPKDDNTKPAHLDTTQIPSNTLVSRLEIKVVETTDNKSPKGVVLDIKACTEMPTG
jgi:hypothetical protein